MKCPNCQISLKRIAYKTRLVDMCPDPECNFQSEASNIKIDHIYVFYVKDSNGNESIPAFRSQEGLAMPMVAADPLRVQQLKMMVPQLQHSGFEVRLAKFTVREELEL